MGSRLSFKQESIPSGFRLAGSKVCPPVVAVVDLQMADIPSARAEDCCSFEWAMVSALARASATSKEVAAG